MKEKRRRYNQSIIIHPLKIVHRLVVKAGAHQAAPYIHIVNMLRLIVLHEEKYIWGIACCPPTYQQIRFGHLHQQSPEWKRALMSLQTQAQKAESLLSRWAKRCGTDRVLW